MTASEATPLIATAEVRTLRFDVEGMTCDACTKTVSTYLCGQAEVNNVAVDLVADGTSLVEVRLDADASAAVMPADVVEWLGDVGYDAAPSVRPRTVGLVTAWQARDAQGSRKRHKSLSLASSAAPAGVLVAIGDGDAPAIGQRRWWRAS
jgi:cation transport ATPase